MILAEVCIRDDHTPVVTNDVIDAVLRRVAASRINWNPTVTDNELRSEPHSITTN